MIRRYVTGVPLETEAVLNKPEVSIGSIPYLKKTETGFMYELEKNDVVYGLGENVRGINKRGWIYESCCADQPNHHEDMRSLYGAHNFLIISGQDKIFGVFFDAPGKVILISAIVTMTRWKLLWKMRLMRFM